MGTPAVVYVRMAPALRDALRERAAASGVSLNSYVVLSLAACAGPEFLRAPDQGGLARTVAEDRPVAERPPPDEMGSLVSEYVSYWIDRMGWDRSQQVRAASKDPDRVWAWACGRRAEQEALDAVRRQRRER